MLSERLPPPPTFHDTTHQPPSSSCQNSPVCLVDTIPSSSGTDANAFGPANGMKNLNTDAILEGNRLMVLYLILDSVTVRMPRNGWPATLRYYNEKFGCTLDIDAFKKLAQNEAEREIRQEENGERRRIATCLTEPSTLTDTTKYINLRDKFLGKIKEISKNEIRKVVVRTRKHPNELVDSKVLDLINRIIGEYADSCVPMTITEVAQIIQAAQVCYDEATRKEKPRSTLKENIESKISKLVLSKDLLEKARKHLKKIMREFNLNLSSVTDLSEALVKKNESLNQEEIPKENRMFELFRGRFYRGLSEHVESEHVISRDEIVSFWSTMWNKNDDTVTYDDYFIINRLSNWKAAGINGIYNFFIKKLTTLHKYIYDIVKVICLEGTTQADWFYCGLTYLIPKGIPRRGSEYRPITCMSNLYKLTTKCVTKVVQIEVERRGLLGENHLREPALMNIALNKEILNLNLPDWILKFIKVIISKWKIDISGFYKEIVCHYCCLCCTKVTVQTDTESHSTNHLLFIDDLKLFAKDISSLSAITGEAKEFLEVIGLEINKEKSATNDTCCEDTATLLEGVSVYKYLGIIEDSRGIPTRSSFEEVQSKLISRVERLCHTRLNAKKLFSAINQHA
ncbi:hypothetical protein CWI38_2036p0010, partial [Hamiltosporidium tvaerminnensis]